MIAKARRAFSRSRLRTDLIDRGTALLVAVVAGGLLCAVLQAKGLTP